MNSYIKDDLDTIVSPQRSTPIDTKNRVLAQAVKSTTGSQVAADEPESSANHQRQKEWDTIPKKPPILNTEAIKNKWKQLTSYGKSKRSAKP